jgi:hypothetical protein
MTAHDTSVRAEHHAGGGHEKRDVTFRPIVLGGIGFLIVAVIIFVAMRWLIAFYAAREAALSPARNPLAASYAREVPPEPRLQTAPILDLQALHTAEDAVLNNYGWINQPNGNVRIPIARAMELLAQRGLPARAPQ